MALPKISVPRYDVVLPSTGKTLKMRPYLVKEEKVLMIALESSDPGQIANAVRSVIKECYSLDDVNSLTTFDIEYLFLQLRGKSVGEEMELQIKCEHCEELNPLHINVNDIKITNVNEDHKIVMLTDKVGVKMRWPSVKTFSELNVEKLNSVEGLMDLIIECIESIFDDDAVYDNTQTSKEEMEGFIENLNSSQFKKVQAFFQDMPIVEYTHDMICSSCGEKSKIELRGLQSFFS